MFKQSVAYCFLLIDTYLFVMENENRKYVTYLTLVPTGHFLGANEINISREDASHIVSTFKSKIIRNNEVSIGARVKVSSVLKGLVGFGLNIEGEIDGRIKYWTEDINEENNQTEMSMRNTLSVSFKVKVFCLVYWQYKYLVHKIFAGPRWEIFPSPGRNENVPVQAF